MKKLYTFVMLMFAVSAMFAQQFPVVNAVPNTTELPKIANYIVDSKTGADGWFNYAQGVAIYMYGENYMQYQSELIKGWPMLSDRVGRFPYSNGTTIPQIQAFAQVFDFSKPTHWTELYETVGNGIPVPGTGTSWGIDSVEFFFNYTRGKNVPDDIVDTLIVSYAINMDNEKIYYLSTDKVEKAMNLYIPPYSFETFGFDEAGFDSATVITEKFELDTASAMAIDEEGRSSFYVCRFPAPEALRDLNCKVMAISFTYRASMDNRTDSSVMGTDMNRFQALTFADPRPEYQQDMMGSKELQANMNTSLYAGSSSYDKTSKSWYKKYLPSIMWQVTHPRPYIGFHMSSCVDCGVTKVEDMQDKTINVYPNPASSVVTLQLADNSQANVQLFNLVGQVVMSEQVNGQDQVTLNVNNLNSGVYMLKVNQAGKVYTSKLIVR